MKKVVVAAVVALFAMSMAVMAEESAAPADETAVANADAVKVLTGKLCMKKVDDKAVYSLKVADDKEIELPGVKDEDVKDLVDKDVKVKVEEQDGKVVAVKKIEAAAPKAPKA